MRNPLMLVMCVWGAFATAAGIVWLGRDTARGWSGDDLFIRTCGVLSTTLSLAGLLFFASQISRFL